MNDLISKDALFKEMRNFKNSVICNKNPAQRRIPNWNDAVSLVGSAPVVNRWISVEDKLPPLDTNVLVFSHGDISVCSLIQPDKETADVVWEDAYGYWDDDEGVAAVTHWMALPEPPIDG